MQLCSYVAMHLYNYDTRSSVTCVIDLKDRRCRLQQDMVAQVLLSFELLFANNQIRQAHIFVSVIAALDCCFQFW